MSFFYKNESLETQSNDIQILAKTGAEIVVVMFEKLKQSFEDYRILKYCDENSENLEFAIGKIHNNKVVSFFSSLGDIYLDSLIDLSCGILKEVTINEVFLYVQKEALYIANKMFDNFFLLKQKKLVYDKYNQPYDLIIIENSNNNYGSSTQVVSIYLISEGVKIGFMEVSYNTQLDGIKQFVNKTYTHVAYVELKAEYQNKGLGYIMYFNMAQFLNTKGFVLKISDHCSIEAQRVWNRMSSNWKEQIILEDGSKTLKITEHLNLIFKNKKPLLIK